ncbi:tetratricopeptide repeat-containing diguanylate cyclase [Alishewanella tabrizica]|uniref:tetratricopeptide repeat-containing diguanylate cyclase n=1 Tax=Alishewanella tabrizica TaxID=671278 RepID=UPI001675E76A|nr:diguanylate cyclase [Alishewanella tabrizica]
MTITKYLAALLFSFSLLLLPSVTAQETVLGDTLTAGSAALRDAKLEQDLDDYLSLTLVDPEQASTKLQQIISALPEKNALDQMQESAVRALTYQLFAYLYQPNPTGVDEVLATLNDIKNTTQSANAFVEIMAAELEVLTFRNDNTQAYINAEILAGLVADVENPRVKYWVNALLALVFRRDTQYEKSLKHYELALDALSGTNDSRTLVRSTSLRRQIAIVHTELKDWARARSILEEVYSDIKRYNAEHLLPDLYLSLGFVVAGQKDYAAAEEINLKGLAGAKVQKQQTLVLTFMNNLGSVYIEQQNYPAAMNILQEALTEAIALNDQESVNLIGFNIGYLDVLTGQAEAGLTKMHSAFAYYQQRNDKIEIEGLLGWFAKAYKALNDYPKLAETLEWQMQLREEIAAAASEKITRDLLARYELKSQTQQITILQQQNELQNELIKNKQLQQTITLLFGLIMLFAAFMLINLYRKVRKTNRRLKEVNKQLEFQSLRDPLTGLLNRRALQDHMAKRHAASDPTPCSLLLLDIDFFKQINDNFGHAAGDAVLIEISRRLATLVSDKELLIRWGGEEFLMLLNRPEQRDIDQLCQSLLKEVSQLAVTYEGRDINVTISGGFINLPFAKVPESQFNWEKVLQVADMALYLSKVNGRNQIHLIDGLNVPFAVAEPHLQSDLNGAVRENMVKSHTING